MDLDDEPGTPAEDSSAEPQTPDASAEPVAARPGTDESPGRTARRRRMPTRAAATGLVLILVLALVATAVPEAVSLVHQRDALRRQEASTSLAAQALAVDSNDAPLAARLALAAYRVSPTPAAVAALARVSQDNAPVKRILQADSHPIMATAQDPDGTDVYAASDDGILRRWDMSSGRLLAQTTAPSPLGALAADPSGGRLLSVDGTQSVQLWSTADRTGFGKPTMIADHLAGAPSRASVVGVGFYDTGTRIYAFLDDGTFVTASATNPAEEIVQKKIGTVFKAAGVSPVPDGSGQVVGVTSPYRPSSGQPDSRILLATSDHRVVWLDLDTGLAAEALGAADFPDGIDDLGLDPLSDGTRLAVAAGGAVNVWALPSGHSIGTVEGVPQRATGVAFYVPSGPGSMECLAVATPRGVVVLPIPPDTGLHDPLNASLSVPHGGPVQAVSTPVPTGHGSLLAIASETGRITVLDQGTARRELPRAEPSTVMAFDGHGDLLLDDAGQSNRAQGLYSITPASGPLPAPGQKYTTVQSYLPPTTWWPKGQSFFANDAILDDRFAAVAGQDPGRKGVVLVWDAKTGAPIKNLTMPGGPETENSKVPNFAVAVRDDPALDLLIARDGDGRVVAWSTKTWQQTMLISTGASGGDLTVSPDGTTAAVGLKFGDSASSQADRKSALGLIDLRTRRLTQHPQQSFPYRIDYSPRGDRIAVVTSAGTLLLLSASGTPETDEIKLPSYASGLAYSPAGDRVAVTLHDSETVLYDAATGARISADLPGQFGYITEQPAWAPTGSVLAVAVGRHFVPTYVQSTAVELWDMNPADWAAGMCTLAGVGLTPAEWTRYTGGGVPFVKLC